MLLCRAIDTLAFTILVPHLLGLVAITLAVINLYKYRLIMHASCAPFIEKRPIYLVRFMNWLVFGAAFFIFPFIPLMEGRALLRISLSFMMISELAYHYYHIVDMVKGVWGWILQLLR
jgi:hypothetical protein